jgi:hypothetical protein
MPGGNSSGNRESAVSLNGLNARAVRFQFEGLATRAVYDFGTIFDLLSFSSVLPPLDVVISLGMDFDFAAHAILVAELSLGSSTAG